MVVLSKIIILQPLFAALSCLALINITYVLLEPEFADYLVLTVLHEDMVTVILRLYMTMQRQILPGRSCVNYYTSTTILSNRIICG